MNEELEKLIELAIADGQISDKEREVILNKAVELGEDKDEVEMILDGRIAQLLNKSNNSPKGQNRFIENICPNCGEKFKSIYKVCEKCGYASKDKNISGSLQLLIEKLEKEERKKYDDNYDRVLKKIKIINQYKLPNNHEDIKAVIEYVIFMIQNSSADIEEIEAWYDIGWSAIEKGIGKTSDKDQIKELENNKIQINNIYKEAVEINRRNFNRETKSGAVKFLMFLFLACFVLLLFYAVISFIASSFLGTDIWVFW